MIYTAYYQSPLGPIFLAAEEKALIGLWFEGQKYYRRSLAEGRTGRSGKAAETEIAENADYPVLREAAGWLDRYFAGEKPEIAELRLAPRGSEFQQAVWDILCRIPYGQLTTYGEIAKALAERMGRKTMSAQAVGGAVGRNPISVIIPCHRVVGTDGSLTGYAGGIDRKKSLLALEGADLSGLFTPKKGTAL